MFIRHYKGNRRLSWDEIQQEFPEVAKQIAQEDNWSMYEQNPDFTEVSPEIMRWIPDRVRNGESDERIDSIMLTK